jgi:hypothetical protein
MRNFRVNLLQGLHLPGLVDLLSSSILALVEANQGNKHR